MVDQERRKLILAVSTLSQDIADSAYKVRKGRPQLLPSFSVIIADTLFSLLVQSLFLVQSMAVSLLPINYFGIACNVHLCLLYSLYSFEYKWCNMGWELHKRLTYIEINWPYFLGFGTILTFLTQLSSSYIIKWVKLIFVSALKTIRKIFVNFSQRMHFRRFFPIQHTQRKWSNTGDQFLVILS